MTAHGPPDATASLCGAIARGDERAFLAFHAAWFDRLYAKARALTRRDEAFCLDVLQDVMLKVVQKMPVLRSEAALGAWLARALVRTALDRLREERRRQAREAQAAVRDGPGGRDDVTEERLAWLSAQLAELPAAEHALLLARFAGGGTFEVLGTGHGMTGDAAAGRIRRTLHRLRGLARRWRDG